MYQNIQLRSVQGSLGQFNPGGAIKRSVGRLKILEGRLQAGQIDQDQYETEKSRILLEEGLTEEQAQKELKEYREQHPSSPLFKVGLFGFGSGVVTVAALFLLYKFLD